MAIVIKHGYCNDEKYFSQIYPLKNLVINNQYYIGI